MRDEYILSIDCGTQSIRAMIFDKHGKILGKNQVEFTPYFSEHIDWAEQDVEVYWSSLCKATNGLKNDCLEIWDQVKAVVVTTIRDTFINIDKSGKVLRPAIVWLDQRTEEDVPNLSFMEKAVFKGIGMEKTLSTVQKSSKAHWIKKNQPEIWRKTYKFIMLSCYFHYKLTGNLVDSISNQIGHIPFNYKKKEWAKGILDYRWKIFGIEKDKLPLLVDSGEIIGRITKKASEETGINEGVYLIAGASDKGCETLGNGCLNESKASISFGTTTTVQTTTKEYVEADRFMPAYPSAIHDRYNPEIAISRGYWLISWFKNEFSQMEILEAEKKGVSPEEILNERLKEVPPGCDGLILQPYWGGGAKNPDARGAIVGFGDVHTKAHIYRAIIEGINYALLDGIEKIEKVTETRIREIAICGGGAQSDIIAQITADMFNRKVYKGQTHELSSLGAAIIGYVTLGVYRNYEEAIENMFHRTKEFLPDPEHVELYSKLYKKVYLKVYPSLRGLYKEIKSIETYSG
ncbi:FGGY-family carbohydrate kinase [Hathewaya histolytica]|uniref:Carbohydrate kinase FGGY n=1 Tax=Hathewaya histolytica TaxID=1498 RepID=A0A4U9R0Q4_HATHI|nr:FGGY-family carbohydrate kinase [Hathewaya histolytica]VTQ83473.1 carbohydrate kinase FGGY [Hathewaya histolytica]